MSEIYILIAENCNDCGHNRCIGVYTEYPTQNLIEIASEKLYNTYCTDIKVYKRELNMNPETEESILYEK